MVPQNKKHSFRILPLFIFCAVLMLSVKINNVFDLLKDPEAPRVAITSSRAFAEEKMNKETKELTRILDQEGTNSDTTPETAPASAFTQSEIQILQELAERREALDIKDKEIDKKAVQLKVAEEEIAKKLQQLKEYEARLKKLINEYDEKEQEKINSLIKLYSTMKPKDAARIFNTLDLDILTALLKGMKPSVSSAILAQMKAEKAKAVTAELMGNNL